MDLYIFGQAILWIVVGISVISIALYIFRNDIARLIGNMKQKSSVDVKNIIQNYHDGIENFTEEK